MVLLDTLEYSKAVSIFLKTYSMSIATMKAKSLTLYGKSHSKGPDGFSLNGTFRGPPIGENLGRSVTRTPFRGPAPMGHGEGSTCRLKGWRARICGSGYPIIIQRSCLGTPQTLVKRSTMNQLGMLEERYTGILHGEYPKTHVYKVDKAASGYTQTLGRKVLTCDIGVGGLLQSRYVKKEVGVYNDEFHRRDYSKYPTCRPYTKTLLGLDYSQYTGILSSDCDLEGLYKGINCCRGGTIGGSDNASNINKD